MVVIEKFTATLVGDVIAARETLSVVDTQVNRRNLVRATLAAVEGLVWFCREQVRDTAQEMGKLTPLADMALRQQTYTVNTRGEVIATTRYITLESSIRLIGNQAMQMAPSLKINFDEEGWSRLRKAIEIRNRITHPKTLTDLDASDLDILTVGQGFEWLLAIVTEIFSAIVSAFSYHTNMVRNLLDELKRGDPGALALYQAQLARSE